MRTALVALSYYATARLGLLLQLPGTNASPVWPPSGIGLAAVLIFGLRVWPGIAIAAFLANLLTLPHTPAGLLAAGAICLGNTLEQVVALLLIRRFVPAANPFERARDVFAFVVAALVACAVASTNGTTGLWLTGIIPNAVYGRVWFTWWLGDTAGMLVLTPALYCWWRAPALGLSRARSLEFVALVASAALTAEFLFGGWVASAVIDSLPYLIVPSLMWAAFRFGQREAGTLAALYSASAVWHTWSVMQQMTAAPAALTRVFAPFVSPATNANDSLLMLQLFIGAVAITAVTLAAAVAERTRAVRVLTDAEASYRDLYDNATEFHASINPETARIEQCNLTLARALGMPREEIVGLAIFDLYHPDCLDDVQKAFAQFRATGTVQNDELQLRRQDGSKIAVLLSISTVRDADGNILRNRSTWTDITERKQAEVAVRANEHRTRQLIEGMPQLVWTCNPDGQCDYLSPQWVKYTGIPEAVQLGYVWAEAIHPDDREPLMERWQHSASTGVNLDVEFRIRGNDGEYRWFKTRAIPVRDSEGKIVKWFGTNTDCEEQKRAEKSLRQLNAELEQRVQDRTAELSRANAHLLSTNEELHGQRRTALNLAQDAEVARKMAEQTAGALAASNAELEREIEQRSLAEERALASVREKEVLLSEIHHRVKNNLAVISSLFYLQSTHTQDEQTLRTLQEGQDRVRSMALVHETLYQSESFAALDFAEYTQMLCDQLFRSYGPAAGNIRMRTNLENVSMGIDLAVPCGLILNELVSNALKHAFPNGRGGEIVVTLRYNESGACSLQVADNGIGVPADRDLTATRTLGLRLIRSLARQLDAQFELIPRSPGAEARLTFQVRHAND